MENTSSALDSGGKTPHYTLFIDTNLDTHLAMIVSDSDTVSDLKKKIMYEHPLCFPNVGRINIHALKVKRKGYFYHLSDSMFVKSAFEGVSKSWFLSVDASSQDKQTGNQQSAKPNSGDIVACFGMINNLPADGVNLPPYVPARKVSNGEDSSLPQVQRDQSAKPKPAADPNANSDCNILSLKTTGRSDSDLSEKHDLFSKEYEEPLRDTDCKEDDSRNMAGDAEDKVLLESSKAASVVKKKRRVKKRGEDKVHDHALKEDNVLSCISEKDASHQDNVNPDNSLLNEDKGRVVAHSMERGSKDITDEPCRISYSDANERPGNEIQMIDDLCEETAVPSKLTECETCNSENAVVKVQCNTSMEEASPGPAVKKKQKTLGKDDNENSSKDNRVLLCDSTRETSEPGITISQCPLGDKQKETNATFDHLSTELRKGDHLVIASPNSGKRKRKKKSSKSICQVVSTAPPSTEEDGGEISMDIVGVNKNLEREPDASLVPEQSVQETMTSEPCFICMKENTCVLVKEIGEKNEVTSSFDIGMSVIDAVNVKSKNSSPHVAAVSEDLQTIAAEGNSSLDVQEANNINIDRGISRNENVIVSDGQKVGIDQTAEVAEERELSQNNDPNAMPAKSTTSNRDEISMNSKADVTSYLFDANANMAPGKSSKKRKKSNKTRDTVPLGTEHTTSSAIDISSVVPHEPAIKDHSSDKSRKEENLLSPVMGKEVSKTTVNTSSLATDRETDNVIRNVLESLQEISKNPVNAENKDEKSRKKTKRKRNSASKSLPDMQTENATQSVNDITEVEVYASSKLTKKTKLVKMSSKHQLNVSNREPENNAVFEACPEGHNEGRPLQDLNSNFPKSGFTDEANNHAEVSCESDRTIVNDNFVRSQHNLDVMSDEVLVDKVTITNGAENVVKAGNDKKKLDVHSNGPSPDLQSSLKFQENQGNIGKAQAFKSSTVESQRSLLKGDGDSRELEAKTKLPKVSGIGARAPPSKKSDKFNQKLDEATRANAVTASGTHTHSNKNEKKVAASSSGLESSKKLLPRSKTGDGRQSHVEIRKLSNNNENGEVVNSSKPKKSLLATSIFKDDSDGSSDEDGVDNSDNSTRTPSDNSLSSDYSDGGSTAQQNGSYGSERKRSARRNITKTRSNVKLDTILRSSSRYKAAKLTASQSQLEDTESQPDEFVPDSQANP